MEEFCIGSNGERTVFIAQFIVDPDSVSHDNIVTFVGDAAGEIGIGIDSTGVVQTGAEVKNTSGVESCCSGIVNGFGESNACSIVKDGIAAHDLQQTGDGHSSDIIVKEHCSAAHLDTGSAGSFLDSQLTAGKDFVLFSGADDIQSKALAISNDDPSGIIVTQDRAAAVKPDRGFDTGCIIQDPAGDRLGCSGILKEKTMFSIALEGFFVVLKDTVTLVTTHDEGTELGIVGIVVVFGIVVTGILFSDHIEMERRFLINIDHTACAHIQISDDSLFGIVEIDVT